jgi:flagellar biosynthesis protein FliR
MPLAISYWLSASLTFPLHPILIFIIVLARVGGMVTFAPFWSSRTSSTKVRVVLALALALVITPVVSPHLPTPPTHLIGLAIMILGELLIGLLFGFVGRVVFNSLGMAAQILSLLMGFSLASVIDPSTRAQTTAIGTIAQMFGIVVMLGVDGHHWLLTSTMQSFYPIPPGDFRIAPALIELLIRLTANSLAVGVALAAPAVVTLLTVEVTLAIAGRASQRLEIMVLGFPIKIAIGLWLLGASLYFLPSAWRTALDSIRTTINQMIGT